MKINTKAFRESFGTHYTIDFPEDRSIQHFAQSLGRITITERLGEKSEYPESVLSAAAKERSFSEGKDYTLRYPFAGSLADVKKEISDGIKGYIDEAITAHSWLHGERPSSVKEFSSSSDKPEKILERLKGGRLGETIGSAHNLIPFYFLRRSTLSFFDRSQFDSSYQEYLDYIKLLKEVKDTQFSVKKLPKEMDADLLQKQLERKKIKAAFALAGGFFEIEEFSVRGTTISKLDETGAVETVIKLVPPSHSSHDSVCLTISEGETSLSDDFDLVAVSNDNKALRNAVIEFTNARVESFVRTLKV